MMSLSSQKRCDTEGVGAGLDRQVKVGEIGGLAAAGVDDDHRSLRVLVYFLEYAPRLVESVTVPRVLAKKDRYFGVMEVPMGVCSGQMPFDPSFAGLFLGKSIRSQRDTECPAGR